MNHYYTYIALDLANERTREARDASQAARYREAQPPRRSLVRYGLATGMAAVSRGSAAVTRRLDDRIADDLGRSLAPSE